MCIQMSNLHHKLFTEVGRLLLPTELRYVLGLCVYLKNDSMAETRISHYPTLSPPPPPSPPPSNPSPFVFHVGLPYCHSSVMRSLPSGNNVCSNGGHLRGCGCLVWRTHINCTGDWSKHPHLFYTLHAAPPPSHPIIFFFSFIWPRGDLMRQRRAAYFQTRTAVQLPPLAGEYMEASALQTDDGVEGEIVIYWKAKPVSATIAQLWHWSLMDAVMYNENKCEWNMSL